MGTRKMRVPPDCPPPKTTHSIENRHEKYTTQRTKSLYSKNMHCIRISTSHNIHCATHFECVAQQSHKNASVHVYTATS